MSGEATNSGSHGEAPAPVLLADASWYGTLAAVRDLGVHGVPVTLATDVRFAPARWSRYVSAHVPCPSARHRSRFLEWLLDFGERRPGHVLCPTSDDVAWILAASADELSSVYHVSTPPLSGLVKLLDKAQLVRHAAAAGLETPATLVPEDEHALSRWARELGFPLFIKPRIHVFGKLPAKGVRVSDASELLPAWRSLRQDVFYDEQVRKSVPDIAFPVVQECLQQSERIYTVNGYFNGKRGLHTSIACVKRLQRPRGSGPGIVFEHAEVDPSIDAALGRLFDAVGFVGVYDVEFLEQGSHRQLIDINPRFYNHMAFEVERGMHLPWLAYLAAIGDFDELRRSIANRAPPDVVPRAYLHRLPLAMLLLMQGLSGGMTREERREWREFVSTHRKTATNPARTAHDPRPETLELVMESAMLVRHPRATLKGLMHVAGDGDSAQEGQSDGSTTEADGCMPKIAQGADAHGILAGRDSRRSPGEK
jgi:D-aspartate ligase